MGAAMKDPMYSLRDGNMGLNMAAVDLICTSLFFRALENDPDQMNIVVTAYERIV